MTVSLFSIAPAENNILLPHTYDLVWGILAFIPLALVFIVFVLPKFNQVLDERTRTIEQGIADAEAAKAELTKAEHDADAIRDEARNDAVQMRKQAKAEAQQILAQARQRAQAEAKQTTESALAQIQAEKESASVALRNEVGSLAVALAEKIIREQLKDQELTNRVIERSLDSLEQEV